MVIYTSIGLLLSVIVHLATVGGLNLFAESEFTFLLHAAIFPSFFYMILSARKNLKGLKRGEFNSLLFKSSPKFVAYAGIAVFVYALVNFGYSMLHLLEGSPTVKDGVYILENHGRHVKDLTELEYFSLKRMELRGFSGHWLLFFMVPFIYFKYVEKKYITK